MKYRLAAILAVLTFCINAAAQDRYSYLEADANLHYEWFADTYKHSGYSFNINFDYHFHKTFYASTLIHAGYYEGRIEKEVPVNGAEMTDGFSDSISEWMWGIGPGADLISNRSDRIFVCLYAGVGGTARNRETFNYEGGFRESDKSTPFGFAGMIQLGYEHCFNNGFVLGGTVNGLYVAGGFSWCTGLRLGFRF